MFASLKNIEAPEPASLLIPKQIATFCLLDSAAAIFPYISEMIVPDELGVYMADVPSVYPLVTPKDYMMLKDGTPVVFAQLGTINEDVYGSNGKILIPKSLMEEKHHKLSLHPQVSRVVINMVKAFLDSRVANATYWASNAHSRNTFEKYFTNGGSTNEAEDLVKRFTSQLSKQVTDFVYEDSWCIVETYLMGSTYTVVRSADWRAYQWTVQEHDKQHPELYE